ncbi:hypothetical protein FDECE_17167 [Fusarium decemcellulare]|nr:hypothetical protein FDECE_17167 [Fusarium decemcellulare]
MVKVAVAGGTGHVGRTIVETLVNDPRHDVFVLTRKAPEPGSHSATILEVDYDNIAALAGIMESNEIHTVISCILVMSDGPGIAQLNLIKAAKLSATTHRFVASEWGFDYPSEVVPLLPHLAYRMQALDALENTSLEWTRFINGYFLDYYGIPHIKSHLQPVSFVIDIENKAAGIPGTGNDRAAFTYSYDLAKFVASFLTLMNWDRETYVMSDKITWNEFLALAEEARGTKFLVKYDDSEKLRDFRITELPSHIPYYPFFPKEQMQRTFAVFGLCFIAGKVDIPEEKSLNAMFPEISTLKVADMLQKCWGKK